MRVKTKGFLTGATIVALAVLAVLLSLFLPHGATTANAATTNNIYIVMFDYECSYHARSSYGNNDSLRKREQM